MKIMNNVQRFEINTNGRDFVLGDLHGCYEDFLLALKAINFDEKVDRIFSVGDLIDRGPNSHECGMLIHKPWFHATRGNHEDMMIQSILKKNHNATGTWTNNGGDWIYHKGSWHLKYSDNDLVDMAADFDELPYVIVVGEGTDRFNIVHAEFNRQSNVNDADIDNWTFTAVEMEMMLWGRGMLGYVTVDQLSTQIGLSQTYVGHTPTRRVLRCFQQMYIDTGCVYSYFSKNPQVTNMLSLACPKDEVVYQWSPMGKKLSKVLYGEIPTAQSLINTETRNFRG